tara:strand:+ start:4584 stop:5006 length:423 start_codon:yes stop_codon:yes gene_type:complete
MTPMNAAWMVLKTPIHDTDAGVRFVTQGKDEPKWADDPNVYGYVPSGGNTLGDTETEMMTPNQFLEHTGPIYEKTTPRQEGDDYYQQRMDNPEALFGMPWLSFEESVEKPRMHEGRHRMTELKERGHGDTSLPVRVKRWS